MGSKAGAAGCILLLPSVFIILILTILGMVNITFLAAAWYQIMSIVGSIILYISVLLVSSGARTLGKHYGAGISTAAGIIGIVAVIIGMVSVILGFVLLVLPIVIVAQAAIILGLVSLIMIGVFLILLGVTFIIIREKTGVGGLSMGAGIMALIAGALFCTIIISFIGMMILIPAAICAALVFMRAKGLPGVEVKEGKKLAVKAVEAKPKKQKPADVEAEVYKYVKSHPSGIDVADCAERLGVSEGEVQKSINALVKKGKLELG